MAKPSAVGGEAADSAQWYAIFITTLFYCPRAHLAHSSTIVATSLRGTAWAASSTARAPQAPRRSAPPGALRRSRSATRALRSDAPVLHTPAAAVRDRPAGGSATTTACGSASATAAFPTRSPPAVAALALAASTCHASRRPRGLRPRPPRHPALRPCPWGRRRERRASLPPVPVRLGHPTNHPFCSVISSLLI